MGCHSSVEGPGAGALNNHLVEAGDETRLVLPARSAVRWRSGHRLGNLGRREGRVSLLQGCHARAPLLLESPPRGSGPRVEANPWASGLWSLGAWEGADCCCWLRPPPLPLPPRPPLPLPPPPPWFGAGEEERHEDEEQADIVEAARAVSEETLPSLVRRISFRRSMSVPALKSGRTAELAMMSAVLVKRGLRPRRRVSTSCGPEMPWLTSRRVWAVCFICWA